MHPVVEQELLIEKAIAYITPHLFGLPVENKPMYLHSVRVGLYLRKKGYAMDIVLAGFLHDLIEDTEVTYEDLVRDRGTSVAELVLANTKDMSLPRGMRGQELMMRVKTHSKGSAIIKAVDLMDGYEHYIRTENTKELESKKKNMLLLVEDTMREDEVFEEVRKVIE